PRYLRDPDVLHYIVYVPPPCSEYPRACLRLRFPGDGGEYRWKHPHGHIPTVGEWWLHRTSGDHNAFTRRCGTSTSDTYGQIRVQAPLYKTAFFRDDFPRVCGRDNIHLPHDVCLHPLTRSHVRSCASGRAARV